MIVAFVVLLSGATTLGLRQSQEASASVLRILGPLSLKTLKV